jgi:hypothetical protein
MMEPLEAKTCCTGGCAHRAALWTGGLVVDVAAGAVPELDILRGFESVSLRSRRQGSWFS